jgi:ubiquinone/menaquinone biosynthesis C-methylase UbiE
MLLQIPSRELAEQAWVEVADLLDLQLSPLGLAAIDELAPQAGQVLLDIGCGAGQTLQQLADRVGPTGRVVGVDVAPRLLALARSRTAGRSEVHLLETDAATLALPDDSVDGVFSRFGVMAIHDEVAAFSNFHRMTKPAGRLSFVCWRSLSENELDYLPLRASELDATIDPTPFKFENRVYLEYVLRSAGYVQVKVQAVDTLVSSGDLEAMTRVLTKVGPLGKLLRENPALLPRVDPKVRLALAARADRTGAIALKAATWLATAVANQS